MTTAAFWFDHSGKWHWQTADGPENGPFESFDAANEDYREHVDNRSGGLDTRPDAPNSRGADADAPSAAQGSNPQLTPAPSSFVSIVDDIALHGVVTIETRARKKAVNIAHREMAAKLLRMRDA